MRSLVTRPRPTATSSPVFGRVLALLGAALLSAGAAAEESWLEDPISRCRVWVGDRTSALLITWSGGCREGRASGPGVLTGFAQGRVEFRFRGRMEAGKGVGFGVAHYRDGAGYARYEGEFSGSAFHGEGTLVLADGSRYQGDFEHDVPSGTGLFVDTGSNRYHGQFRNGLPHGEGSDRSPTGERYSGQYAEGERHGQGTLVNPQGFIYTGDFEAGAVQGSGRLELASGVYEGRFVNGEPSGSGTFTTAGGDVYRGTFADGRPDGAFVVSRADGTTEEQTWRAGELVR